MDITEEQAIRNAVASAEMKGIHPTKSSLCSEETHIMNSLC